MEIIHLFQELLFIYIFEKTDKAINYIYRLWMRNNQLFVISLMIEHIQFQLEIKPKCWAFFFIIVIFSAVLNISNTWMIIIWQLLSLFILFLGINSSILLGSRWKPLLKYSFGFRILFQYYLLYGWIMFINQNNLIWATPWFFIDFIVLTSIPK